MSQEYEPVTWQDETTGQQGTLINAERLDQMQTAHHYADGWEEVDAVPSGDPGVDYHKVVYCTADSTFYRWNGSAWTKDIDDVTKAELDAEIERATLAEEALDSAKADKATTLAGYGITDAYTKSEIDTKLTGGMHYKGSVQTTADLPASGNEVGDFYNVIATGENWAWDGSAWDKTGSIVDLQPITNAEIDTIVAS